MISIENWITLYNWWIYTVYQIPNDIIINTSPMYDDVSSKIFMLEHSTFLYVRFKSIESQYWRMLNLEPEHFHINIPIFNGCT